MSDKTATAAFHEYRRAQLAMLEASMLRELERMEADLDAYEDQRRHEEQCASEEYDQQD